MVKNAEDDPSDGGTGRRPATALIALLCLVGLLLLFGALPAVSTPLSGDGDGIFDEEADIDSIAGGEDDSPPGQAPESDGELDDGEAGDGEPDDSDPDDGEPDDGEPDDGEPGDGEPDDGEPDDGEPDDGEPDDGEPDDGEPDDGEPDDGESGDENLEAQITLEDDPIPGEELTVTVTRGDEPVVGTEVTFNEELVGDTDAGGQVTGTVPYAEELEISVAGSEPATRSASATRGAHAESESRATSGGENVSVDLPTDLDLEFDGEKRPGGTVTTNVTIDDTPIEGATVAVDGEPVGETGVDGTVQVSLPQAEAVTITATRGSLEGEADLELAEMSVSLEADPVALPTRPGTVVATMEDEPVSGVPVYLDGERVGETDENGTATVSLPPELSTTAAVGVDGELGSATARPLVNALVGVGLIGLGTVLSVKAVRGRDVTQLASRLTSLPMAACRRLLTAIVVVSQRVDRLATAMLEGLRRALSSVEEARAVLCETAGRIVAGVRSVVTRVAALPSLLSLSALLALVGRGERAVTDTDGAGTSDGDDEAKASEDRATVDAIRESWYWLVGVVPLARPETRTPGEIADRAVDAGLPADAVERILEAFRSVEYGNRAPESSVAERVRESVDRVREREGESE